MKAESCPDCLRIRRLAWALPHSWHCSPDTCPWRPDITWSPTTGLLDLSTLGALYAREPSAVERIVEAIFARISADNDPAVWISTVTRDAALARARSLARLDASSRARLRLFGIPFAVKDNIDASGLPTTAACPAFAYTPAENAVVVQRLLDAGAILIGKTNLDQFATGLVGVRSPYGTPRNAFDAAYVPGGSSSGSAVAVARGLVGFALGTDTAGSGRVPAAFNNIVGLKPTRGAIGTSGVVPACRSLDCVSIFALTVADAAAVLSVAAGDDAADPYGRAAPVGWSPSPQTPRPGFRFGLPRADQRRFFGNREAETLYRRAAASFERLGGTAVDIDYAPFAAVADLLYQGPWVAERLAAIRDFATNNADAMHPVTREITLGARRFDAVAVFEASYTLESLRRRTAPIWRDIDFMLLPSAGTIYRLDEVAREPIQLNTNLGYYTNFVNLLDLSALAVPAGFQPDGLPFGVTLIAPAWHEGRLGGWADAFHRTANLPLGATGATRHDAPPSAAISIHPTVPLLVLGAHMAGMPLNPQLTALAARFVATVKTAPSYRLYDLGGAPARPGLVRVRDGGAAVSGELYDVPTSALGSFLAQVAPPLSIGSVELESGEWVKGFLCEAHASNGAKDITAAGGWRRYLKAAESA
ncbi:MAG: allophanate hydrolase [Rhodospirillaceae bacterium]|nr:allophanate hydrolase [Rhodospirillaceae bacterium]